MTTRHPMVLGDVADRYPEAVRLFASRRGFEQALRRCVPHAAPGRSGLRTPYHHHDVRVCALRRLLSEWVTVGAEWVDDLGEAEWGGGHVVIRLGRSVTIRLEVPPGLFVELAADAPDEVPDLAISA